MNAMPVAAPAGRFRVLVVDDEPNVLSALQRLLRSRGYQVDTAEGGAAALAQLAQLQPHGIISDMRMPGMNGAEFLKASRAHSPNAVRLLLTGHADITSALQAVNEGEVFRYLTKPWDDTLLIAALEEGLERHRLRAERDQLLDLTARQNAELQELNHNLEGLVQARTDELQQALGRNEQVHQQLKRGFVATMQMFSSLVEARAGLTRGCARRVADHVRRMAPLLGMTAEEQQDTLFAAMLIDLGKVLLPERLTLRPYAELQGEDRNLWLAHPLHAHSLMMGVETLRGAAYVLRSLNERCDGTGVPDRLPAALIGVGTRLLMVAVDYESMLAGAQVLARLNPAQPGSGNANASQRCRPAAGRPDRCALRRIAAGAAASGAHAAHRDCRRTVRRHALGRRPVVQGRRGAAGARPRHRYGVDPALPVPRNPQRPEPEACRFGRDAYVLTVLKRLLRQGRDVAGGPRRHRAARRTLRSVGPDAMATRCCDRYRMPVAGGVELRSRGVQVEWSADDAVQCSGTGLAPLDPLGPDHAP